MANAYTFWPFIRYYPLVYSLYIQCIVWLRERYMRTKPKAQRRFRRAVKKPSVRRVMDEDDVIELCVCGEESTEIK